MRATAGAIRRIRRGSNGLRMSEPGPNVRAFEPALRFEWRGQDGQDET